VLSVALAATVSSLGCATPEQRHRVLTFFFDGVPPLPSDEPEPEPEPAEWTEDTALQLADIGEDESTYSVHGPVAEKECQECHASSYSNRLTMTGEDLCWSCHDLEDFPGEQVHPPVAGGFCLGCHDPHRSKNPFLLVRSPEEICDHCHDQQTFAAIEDHRAEQGSDCQGCHDVHASDRRYMLKNDEDSS
jgi:predicted CXXCH cytochrome family protein